MKCCHGIVLLVVVSIAKDIVVALDSGDAAPSGTSYPSDIGNDRSITRRNHGKHKHMETDVTGKRDKNSKERVERSSRKKLQQHQKKKEKGLKKDYLQAHGDAIPWEVVEAYTYVHNIFNKYGHDGQLSYEGFEHLLENLGLGDIVINDHDIHDHQVKEGFADLHEGGHNHETSGQQSKETTQASGIRERTQDSDSSRHEGFSKRSLDDQHEHDHGVVDDKCMTPQEILYLYKVNQNQKLTIQNFLNICPAILFQVDSQKCGQRTTKCKLDHVTSREHCAKYHDVIDDDSEHHDDNSHSHHDTDAEEVRSFWNIPGKVWGFAVLSVSVISLVGLACVALVPVLHRALYDHLLQVLVALAVGTLTGDALLHLIPHAMVSHDSPKHEDGDSEHAEHAVTVWKGLVVLGGAYLFFVAERVLAMCSDRRNKRRQKHTLSRKMAEQEELSCPDNATSQCLTTHERGSSLVSATLEEEDTSCHDDPDPGDDHHGHSHEAPRSTSAVAWMVIMGDGLHNFTDGLAIGAAFANSLTMGLSTSIAVFCHELPHELGDFAVLLKSGMSVKHALFYNGVSSALCFLGLLIGVAVGNIASVSAWIFALTAGIFIYIALVDMLPEITTHPTNHPCVHLALHIIGITLGIGIMLLIALYENKIKID